MLGISWKEYRTNVSVLEEIGLERELMGKVARMKLYSTSDTSPGEVQEPWQLALTVLEGSVDGLRHQGRPNKTVDGRHRRVEWL